MHRADCGAFTSTSTPSQCLTHRIRSTCPPRHAALQCLPGRFVCRHTAPTMKASGGKGAGPNFNPFKNRQKEVRAAMVLLAGDPSSWTGALTAWSCWTGRCQEGAGGDVRGQAGRAGRLRRRRRQLRQGLHANGPCMQAGSAHPCGVLVTLAACNLLNNLKMPLADNDCEKRHARRKDVLGGPTKISHAAWQGGKGGKGGGGGGGDGEEGGFDFRGWLRSFAGGLGGGARSLAQAAGALALLLTIFYAASWVKPAAGAALGALQWLLRLDGRGSRRVRNRNPNLKPSLCVSGTMQLACSHGRMFQLGESLHAESCDAGYKAGGGTVMV